MHSDDASEANMSLSSMSLTNSIRSGTNSKCSQSARYNRKVLKETPLPRCCPDIKPSHFGRGPKPVKGYKGHASNKYIERLRSSTPDLTVVKAKEPVVKKIRPHTTNSVSRNRKSEWGLQNRPTGQLRGTTWAWSQEDNDKNQPVMMLPKLAYSGPPGVWETDPPVDLSLERRTEDLHTLSTKFKPKLRSPERPLTRHTTPAGTCGYRPWGDMADNNCNAVDFSGIRLSGALKAEVDSQHYLSDIRNGNLGPKFRTKIANHMIRYKNEGWDKRTCAKGSLFGSHGVRSDYKWNKGLPYNNYPITRYPNSSKWYEEMSR